MAAKKKVLSKGKPVPGVKKAATAKLAGGAKKMPPGLAARFGKKKK